MPHISQRYCLGLLPTPVDDEGALVIVYNYNVLLKLFFGQLRVGSIATNIRNLEKRIVETSVELA